MYLDILVLRPGGINLGIEVQGEQHFKPSKFFHKDSAGWLSQKRNDRKKKRLCREKNIMLVEYRYDEEIKEETLLAKIANALEEFNFNE